MIDLRRSTVRAPTPFGLHGAFSSTDLSEIREIASTAQHPLFIDPSGPCGRLRFDLHQHPLSRIVLTRATFEYEGAVRVWAPPLTGHYYLQIPLRGRGHVLHGARVVHPSPGDVALLLSPGLDTTMQNWGAFDEITLEVDAEAVDHAWRSLTGEAPDSPIVFEPAVRLTGEPGTSILRLLRCLVEEAYRPVHTDAGTASRDRLEEALLLRLLQCQPHSQMRELRSRSEPAGATLVRDAEAWMEERCAEGFTVADVAAAQGVTVRTLQRAFERHRPYSPRGFLRGLMLARARTQLRRGEGESVTAVALGVGFRHLGRFSGDYRSRYGESPSTTLRRARRRGHEPRRRVSLTPRHLGRRKPHLLPHGLPRPCGFCVGDIDSA